MKKRILLFMYAMFDTWIPCVLIMLTAAGFCTIHHAHFIVFLYEKKDAQ